MRFIYGITTGYIEMQIPVQREHKIRISLYVYKWYIYVYMTVYCKLFEF